MTATTGAAHTGGPGCQIESEGIQTAKSRLVGGYIVKRHNFCDCIEKDTTVPPPASNYTLAAEAIRNSCDGLTSNVRNRNSK